MKPIGQDRILPIDAIPMRIDDGIDIENKPGKSSFKKIGFNPPQTIAAQRR